MKPRKSLYPVTPVPLGALSDLGTGLLRHRLGEAVLVISPLQTYCFIAESIGSPSLSACHTTEIFVNNNAEIFFSINTTTH